MAHRSKLNNGRKVRGIIMALNMVNAEKKLLRVRLITKNKFRVEITALT